MKTIKKILKISSYKCIYKSIYAHLIARFGSIILTALYSKYLKIFRVFVLVRNQLEEFLQLGTVSDGDCILW